MKYKNIHIVLFIITCICGCTHNAADQHDINDKIAATNLRCELLKNPIGIDIEQPDFSWEIQSELSHIYQKAYQVLVSASKDSLDADIGEMWDSDKITSPQSIQVKYEGKEFNKNTTYCWKVKLWTNKGETTWSETATFQTGFFYYTDWSGRWIGLDRSFPGEIEDQFSRLAARYLRKEFETKELEIASATAYIMGLGNYELYVNGRKAGDHVLSPSPTDFIRNVKYNVLVVTDMLEKGNNAIGVILGNGYFYTMRQHFKPYKIKNFGYPKLMFNLLITYADGSKEVIRTDNSWKITVNGPIRSNNIYDGEEYDARMEMPGWNKVGFNDKEWLEAEYVQEAGGEFEAQLNENMKIMHELNPVSITKRANKKYTLDMDQNLAGWLRIQVSGKKGDKITLRFAESLDEKGELFTAPLRDAKATDIYILKGGGKETWEPRFVYHGFRFVEVSGFPGEPKKEDFTACVVYDEMEKTSSFESSDKILNQIYRNAFWSINATYKGIPIDCPQRNERMPWLGDRAIGCYGESFVMDNSKLYIKWLDDIMYSQKEDGSISDVAPAFFRYYSDNMTWPGTYILVAEMIYRQYGLVDPIVKHYPYMKKWLEYMEGRYLKDNILTKDSYGDWCPPPKTIEEGRGKNANVKHPSALISTAYYFHYLQIMQAFASLIGEAQDIEIYINKAIKVKEAFNQKFYNAEVAGYGENTLTENLLAVSLKLTDDAQQKEVLKTIEKNIMVAHNGHLSSGLVGVQWLMRTLANNGHEDIAFKLATNTTYPSWGYMIENGATTIWELWNANTAAANMNSQNHVMMLGDLIIWYFENLAGIKSSEKNAGFKEIIMKPDIHNSLDFVKASHKSPYGLIKSEWEISENNMKWEILIPANTTANVFFPTSSKENIFLDGKQMNENEYIKFIQGNAENRMYKLGSGAYTFEIKNVKK